MESLDALGGEGQRLALRGGHFRGRGMTLGIGDAQARGVGLDLVELARVVDDRGVAARAHVGDDLGDHAVDILVGVAIAAEECRERLLETRRRGVEPERPDALGVPKRHDAPRGSGRPSRRPARAAS